MAAPYANLEIKGNDIELLDAALRILVPTSQLQRQLGGIRTRLVPSPKGTYTVKMYNPCWEVLTRSVIEAAGFTIVQDPGRCSAKQHDGPADRKAIINLEGRLPVELHW